MKRTQTTVMALFTLLGIACGLAFSMVIQPESAAAQAPGAPNAASSRAFTYQGLLRQGGAPVNTTCDFQFTAWDAAAGGTALSAMQTLTASVSSGLFTVVLNTGNQFYPWALDGRAIWLETAVQCPTGSGGYVTLSPRQALTAAPLASGLVPNTSVRSSNSNPGNAALTIHAPASPSAGNPAGLEAHADPSSIVGTIYPVGAWGDSSTGYGVWGTTDSGSAVYGLTNGAGSAIHGQSYWSGLAGLFEGDVTVSGKLNSRMKATQVINSVGPLPFLGATFTSSGGTLLLYYSGSGFSNLAGRSIGMTLLVDGQTVDSTAIYANASVTHSSFVPKLWVLTGLASGVHTLSLTKLNNDTQSDYNDIFFVTVMELPN